MQEPEPQSRRLNFSLLSSLRPRKSREEKRSPSPATATTTASATTSTPQKTVKASLSTIKTPALTSRNETSKTPQETTPAVVKATATNPESTLPPTISSATSVSFCVKLASLRKHSPKGKLQKTEKKFQIRLALWAPGFK